MEWDRDKITWYIDHKTVRQIANNMGGIGIHNYMEIIINVALQSRDDNKINNSTIFPNHMYVEQANVYRLNCDDCGTPVTEITSFNAYTYGVKKSITMSGATTIPTGSNITLRATDYIELQPGFTVDKGRELYMDVNPCDNAIGIGIGVEHQGGVDP
jgi:beta-glucanase (GH16 family)